MDGLGRRAFLGQTTAGLTATAATGPVLDALAVAAAPQRWPEARAEEWHRRQPWLVGANFVPSTASNQLEMWQAETFDPRRIDQELGWAAGLGMNTARVFLHDLLWEQDAAGFVQRIDAFLDIVTGHGIRPMLVLFDSCWDPFPAPGPQRPPEPGVHNSRWVQGPGAAALADAGQHPRLRAYVEGVVGAFGQGPRVLAWDVWNEPDNTNPSSYGRLEPPAKVELVLALLPQVFDWCRAIDPAQPLTCGVWRGDWSAPERMDPMHRLQLDLSDVVSFHDYGWPEEFERRVGWLRRHGRPILCTEYMARPAGSTFDQVLPLAKAHRVGAINWGLVAGRTQTHLPWDSWRLAYVAHQPAAWFHEVFRADGTPYRERETRLIRELTTATAGDASAMDLALEPASG
jgi:Cellulase (glycosyl hydrolase family 5)